MTECTSYIKNLLSQMSTKFNEQTNSELVKNLDFQEDKTLKWKTLINNTYAKKDREKRNKNRNKDGEDSTAVDDDKNSTSQELTPSSSCSPSTSHQQQLTMNNKSSTSTSDRKFTRTLSTENAEEENESNLILNEKFGNNNVKEKKIVIDGDDLHIQKSTAAQQASSTHTNTKKESSDDVEKNINLPQLNTNSQAITTVTSSTSTTDNKLKHDDNVEIMNSNNNSSSCVGGEDDKRNAGGLTTATKNSSKSLNSSNSNNNNGGKIIIDKTTSSPRNLRSNKHSSSAINTATQIHRQTSNIMSNDDKNKSDEMTIKSDLEENEATNEDSSTTNETSQSTVVKKGRGRPRLDAKNVDEKSVNIKTSLTATTTECAIDQPTESELEMNQKRASRGRMLTRSILESSENNTTTTPTSSLSLSTAKNNEDVEIKKETETDDLTAPKRRGRSRKVIDEKDTDADNKVDVESEELLPKHKRLKSSSNSKKSNESDDNKSETKSTIDDDIKPRLLMTIRTDKSTAVPKIITPSNTNAPLNASAATENDQEEKIVKKRGRRPKAASITNKEPTQVKKSLRLAKDDSDANISNTPTHSPRKDPALLSAPNYGRMRSQRRIKPTAKILENEELRQGFEVTNCKRLSLSNENLMMESYDRSPPSTAANRSGQESSNRSPSSPDSKSTNNNIDIPAQAAEILKNNHKKQCRDPQEFLNEIKSFKIGTNRSPEDNKKLTKSQHRRLLKQKEKHLGMLGLRPKNDFTSSSDESDTEEFNPSTSKANVHHHHHHHRNPAITLRLRNQHKSANEKQRNSQLRKREHVDAMHSDKRMKLSMAEKIPMLDSSDDDDCIVIESRNDGSYEKENNNVNLICSCHQKTKYYMRQGQNQSLSVNGKIFCCAVDEIEKRKIGCTNELIEPLISLYRPSVKVSYMVLCPSHKKRLSSHNCCSGCGLFCTQGTFVICNNKHFFHRNCATKYILNTPYDPNNPNYTGPTLLLKCPHCGIDAPDYDYRVTMRCENLPVFVQHRSNVP